MKLRLNDSSVRLRCAVSDVQHFARAGRTETLVRFPDGRTFLIALSTANSESASVAFTGDRIEISVPAAEAERWTATDVVGIYGRQGDLDIMVEKDFRRTSRPSPDDEDRYPNPAASK